VPAKKQATDLTPQLAASPSDHALQHNQLLPQRGVLKLALGLEERGNQVQEEDYQRGHHSRR
jgi:hypothetical protein